MAKRFITPFAENGDRTSVLDPSQPNGLVNYNQGYTAQYSLDIATEPTARRLNRPRFNQIMFDATSNIQQWQDNLFPSYITDAENGGTPVPYRAGMAVDFNGVNRISLSDNNTTEPSDNANWANEAQRPVILGGTGANTPTQARANLGVIQATESSVGLSRIATEQEAISGVNNDAYIVPSTLLAALAAALTPIGTLLFYSGATVPDGYLEVNGSSFDTVANPQLALIHPSGVLPDMRGVTPMGLDNGRGLDPGRAFGSFQDGSSGITASSSTASGSENASEVIPSDGSTTSNLFTGGREGTQQSINFTGGQPRVRNVAYMWIIRAA